MSTWRSTNYVMVTAICTKPGMDTLFAFNTPIDNRGFVDGHFCEKNASCDKADSKFIHSKKAATRRKIGTHA